MDPFSELSFLGLFNSIVRTPNLVPNNTSLSSSPGNSFGISEDDANDRRLSISGFVILALRGILAIRVREIQLCGCSVLVQVDRRSIGV